MSETHTLHDPFLGKDVEISSKLTDRLRGRYANGPTMPDGEPEFGWREFQTPPIQHEAAKVIEHLSIKLTDATAQVEGAKKQAFTEAMDVLEAMRIRTATNFNDANCQGQRGVDRTDALYDAYHAIRKLSEASNG